MKETFNLSFKKIQLKIIMITWSLFIYIYIYIYCFATVSDLLRLPLLENIHIYEPGAC